ncbi:hypothetical protein AAK913_14295, partial [Enterococcus faecium]|uniref:hypothetical protein n=1 Tax=Enterococcus faecium TaxID=1352 RepID=UPI003518443D
LHIVQSLETPLLYKSSPTYQPYQFRKIKGNKKDYNTYKTQLPINTILENIISCHFLLYQKI